MCLVVTVVTGVPCISRQKKKYTSRHGPEETSSRIAQEVGPQEEVGEAPQEVQEAQQQEGCPQAPQVPQEEALQEG